MIECQGLMDWKETMITCKECNYEAPGLYRRENGISEYSDNTDAMLEGPCPECGGQLEDK